MFPLSNWTELDVWHYIAATGIEVVPLYFAAPRPVVERDGTLIMVDDHRFRFEAGEHPEVRSVRFRTLGCYPLTGAIESTATTVSEVTAEMAGATRSEREGRGDRPRPVRLHGGEEAGGLLLMDPARAADRGSPLPRDLLRLLTCGSVDDGKSTLIGRLLHDSDLLYDDHLAAVRKDSAVSGHAGGQVDLALLADGLKAEREQGITIDVAHLYFSTSRRSFIIADAPGHEQYTRNMVTGASTADLAVILVDAAKGVTTQTRRHSAIVSLLGIKAVVVAVNKMDLVGYAEERFDAIAAEASDLGAALGLPAPVCIPMSALHGDCVVERGASMHWYDGPCLMEHLEQVATDEAASGTGAPPGPEAAAAGPAGHPARPPVPRLRGNDLRGAAAGGGRSAGGTLGSHHRDRPDHHLRRRP